ncbi:MAG: hypothetical protein LBK66_02970 [Spirochaetaceae bacterium]|jgi:hypothetical protein|nr:hypothetical protein [Spirochaetaceae bacterium]
MRNKPPLLIFLFLFSIQFAAPLDFIMQGGIDYSSYPQDNKSHAGDVFKPELLPVGQLTLKDDFARMHSTRLYNYNISLSRDPIWRYTALGDIGYYLGNINIGVGFFTGISNFTFEHIDIGFSGRAGIGFPGIFIANAGFASSVNEISDTGTAARRLITAQVGFWLPHIFFTFDLQIKDYFEQVTRTTDINDSRTRYKGSMEIFSKNVPYRLRFSFGWQVSSRAVNVSGSSERSVYSIFIPGFYFYNQVKSTFAWFVEGEMPFNNYDIKDIKVFYNASIGLIFSYPES